MKIALLGCDHDVLEIARAIRARGTDQIVAVYEAPAWRDQLQPLVGSARWDEQWESLLLGNAADAVIVASGDWSETRVDQLRKLVQVPVPLVLVHPVCEAIVALELDMIRRDTHCVMVSHSPGRLHPAFLQVRDWQMGGETSRLGKVEQIVFERRLADRNRPAVMRQFARDAEMLRCLLGNVNKVSAAGVATKTAVTDLTVHLANAAGVSARWSLAPATGGDEGAHLSLFGAQSVAAFVFGSDGSARLEIDGQQVDLPVSKSGSATAWSDARDTLERLQQSLGGQDAVPTWPVICRTLEVVDAAERSLDRGRTIELQETVVSEQDTFKGMMAAGGCLLLLAALFVVFVFSVIEGIRIAGYSHDGEAVINRPTLPEPLRNRSSQNATNSPSSVGALLRYWPVALVTPLVIFLLLQLLQLVFPPSTKQDATAKRDPGD